MRDDVKEIKVTYADGTEKVINRGVCFSVTEKGKYLGVRCDGIAGDETDITVVLAITSKMARDFGITDELCEKIEAIEKEEDSLC